MTFRGQGAVCLKVLVTYQAQLEYFKCFFCQLHSDYRHGTWPMFSQNYKILKFGVQSLQKFTFVMKQLSAKTLIGPSKDAQEMSQ